MPPEMGACKMCGKGAEDVRHVLLACDAYAGQRTRMFGGTDMGLELAGIVPLMEQSEVDQLDLLLGKTTGVMEADDRISKCVARYSRRRGGAGSASSPSSTSSWGGATPSGRSSRMGTERAGWKSRLCEVLFESAHPLIWLFLGSRP